MENILAARQLSDLKKTGSRELIAEDYAYEIKRLASPTVHSPIFGIMSQYIVGLSDLEKILEKDYLKQRSSGISHPFLDLRRYTLSGVTVLNRYQYQIKLNGEYPQFNYWLAMPFFAPIPWEADQFYATPQFKRYNITLDWYPIGTGPYFLSENNPNDEMVLAKNPNFRGEKFHTVDNKNLAEKLMPFIDKAVFDLEKENIPRWNKFLQGYYDNSGISNDNFNEVIQLDKQGHPTLTSIMQKKGVRLQTEVVPTIYYLGFNMLDDVVGGNDNKHQKLRQAIAIAISYETYIHLFMNDRGIPAQGPIPPGIFGYQAGKKYIDPYVFDWNSQTQQPQRKSLEIAKKLLAEAGYPNGINPKTHHPLMLNYDIASGSSPDDAMQLNWMRQQFAKLGIDLVIRQTDYNRYQDKLRTSSAQLFSLGWVADYPDPENFLFLFSSNNSIVKFGGENATNYSNATFDHLFNQMKNMPNTLERFNIIQSMIGLLQQDTPCAFGFYPISFVLTQQWMDPLKPNAVANNTLKYANLHPSLRAQLQAAWNQPVLWPIGLMLIILALIFLPLFLMYYQRENKPAVKRDLKNKAEDHS